MKLKINESLEGDKPTERWAQINLTCDSEYCYCGNGGRSWVTKDSDHIDTWPTKEEAIADGKENYKSTFKYGRDWDVVKLDEDLSKDKYGDYEVIAGKYNESLNEDALDDHGVSRVNVNLLAKRIPNGRFYFDRNRYVLGKELPDYFDDNEVILCSDYQDSDGIRIPNAYNILKRFVSDKSSTESLKLKESTNSLDDYKVYKILINTLVPNSINLARHLSPNGECYNEIVDVLRKNGLNLADAIIDYKENPELTKRLHDMGIVHGNNTIEELTDKVLKKLDDNGYDTSDKDVRNYAEAAAELIINDVNQDIDDWYSETLINYPEDLEELPKK